DSDYLAVRTKGDPTAPVAAIRRIVAAGDPNVPVGEVETVGEIIDGTGGGRGEQMVVLGAVGALSVAVGGVRMYRGVWSGGSGGGGGAAVGAGGGRAAGGGDGGGARGGADGDGDCARAGGVVGGDPIAQEPAVRGDGDGSGDVRGSSGAVDGDCVSGVLAAG